MKIYWMNDVGCNSNWNELTIQWIKFKIQLKKNEIQIDKTLFMIMVLKNTHGKATILKRHILILSSLVEI